MTRVVVVGAGVIGLFCALRLAQRGAQVTVLEGEKEDLTVFSPTASLTAAGMLAPLGEMARPSERHAQLDRLALDSFDLWRTLSKGALWEDGVRFGGGLVIAADEAAGEAFRQKAEVLGRAARPLSTGQWRKHSGFTTPVSRALFVEDEGVADPVRVLSGLLMDARRHGVQVTYGADVDVVATDGVATFEHGRFDADLVVLAPGPWASDQMRALAPALKHVRPARGHMVPVTLPRLIDANVHGPDFYLTRRCAEDVVLGATMEFDRYDRHVSAEQVALLLSAAEKALPGEVRFRQDALPWVGVRPMSPDEAPMIGPSGGVLVACGHSRNGWLLAPISAEIICAYVFGEAMPPLWMAFAADRFSSKVSA